MKKLLFLQPTWMWDRIAAIPYLMKVKKEWKYKIYLLDYANWYPYKMNTHIINILKDNQLFDEIIITPYNKIKLLFFVIKYLFYFDKVYIPIKATKNLVLFWNVLWRKKEYTFNSFNDQLKYDNVVDGMMWDKMKPLYDLISTKISFPYLKSVKHKFWLTWKFCTIYVWTYSRSIYFEEREKIFNYVSKNWFIPILLWSDNIERESWIMNYINNEIIKKYWIVNLIWRTDFTELCSILKDSKFCITANWWIMRLANALNKKVISFSTCSWLITHSPYDNTYSFHIYKKTKCLPCEQNGSYTKLKNNWFKQCICYKTCKEAVCKKNINSNQIIELVRIFV